MIRWLKNFSGIDGLPLLIVSSSALVFVFDKVSPGLTQLLVLAPQAALAGQFWRFLTFLFLPPPLSPLFLFFWLYLFYVYAESLEGEWGSQRFTAFYVLGAVCTSLVGLVPAPGIVSNSYLNTSLFLAFTTLFPNFELLLFFILPVKVKYLGYLAWAGLAAAFWNGGLLDRLAILAALLNYLIFFGPTFWERWRLWRHHSMRRPRP